MNVTDRRIPRREFVKSAVAIGGLSALSACNNREENRVPTSSTEEKETDTPTVPRGPSNLDRLPERQFAWNEFLVRDPHGNTVLPQHQVLLFLDYAGAGHPTADEREQVEAAFRALERAFQRGTGGAVSAVVNEGLLFTVGYSPSYFDRFDAALPDGAAVPAPKTVLEKIGENPDLAESYDAVVVLTADFGSTVLAAEQALLGGIDRLNGIEIAGSLESVFKLSERRSGFIGKGLPAEQIDDDRVPEAAPQSMGFKSGFTDNQASEDRVSISDGPFADGTTQMVSRLHIDVDSWYEDSESERVERMFSPKHTPEEVGAGGESLAADSKIDRETGEATERHAREHGVVGHTQKTARARDEEFEPRILRRSEGNATDVHEEGVVALNFTSIQNQMEAFVRTRRAMNGDDLDVADHHHGILNAIEVVSRATFLMPPRRHRALPVPRPT
jgi:hypothetical protein